MAEEKSSTSSQEVKMDDMIDNASEEAMTGFDRKQERNEMPKQGSTETGEESFTWMKVVMGEGMIAAHINISAPIAAGTGIGAGEAMSSYALAAHVASVVASAFSDMSRAAYGVLADFFKVSSFASNDDDDSGMGNGKPKGKKGKVMKGKAKGKKKKGQGNQGKGKDHYTGI